MYTNQKLTIQENILIENEFGETSANRLAETIRNITDGILVDIGVYTGASSRIMLLEGTPSNTIYAIDPLPHFNSDNLNYNYIKNDSVLIGKEWDKGKIDLVFFDSVHAKEQVLCELYYWWDLIKEGGIGIFHDTSWEGYLHRPGHHGAGKKPGNSRNGYDTYGGIDWETPDKAVEEFFDIKINTEERDIKNDLFIDVYEDDYISVSTNYACLGMTFIRKKKDFDYTKNIDLDSWDLIFKKREILLSFFKK